MRDPYLILGLDRRADDAAVERAYLDAIKRCPPERDAERFSAIRTAYEQLRTHRDRAAFDLFDTTPPAPADILDKAAPVGAPGRPERGLLEALLRGES
jgi:curved DNA-binding protein CbpA